MNGEILFLAHRLPFPPDRGDRIRAHHLLKALARLAPVHVGCLAESPADRENLPQLHGLAASHCMPMRDTAVWRAGLKALARGVPVSCASFHHPELARWVRQVLATRPISAIYVFSGQMGQFVPAKWQGRLVVDLVDVDSAKFAAYAADARGPMAWVYRREARLLRAMEAYLARRSTQTLLVSEAEAELARSRMDALAAGRIAALPNGIDAQGFDPALAEPHSDLHSGGPHLLFAGQMDYPPNVTAAVRGAKRILPIIRHSLPDAQFHIVGRAPCAEVQALARLPGVRVWGEVPDVRPFLRGADLALVPLMLARGVQNKVLEAMAMACPVLLTPQAATGIAARDGVHFAIADEDAAIASKALELLANRAAAQAMGQAARALVVQGMGWAAALADLPDIMGYPPQAKAAEARDAA